MDSVGLKYNVSYATLYRHVKNVCFEKLGRFSVVLINSKMDNLSDTRSS
jgi:hypothetical protein